MSESRLDGPQVLCLRCGAVANHVSLLCRACRGEEPIIEVRPHDLIALPA